MFNLIELARKNFFNLSSTRILATLLLNKLFNSKIINKKRTLSYALKKENKYKEYTKDISIDRLLLA